jgi:uncharacterized protein
VVYLDASALTKLIRLEPESGALVSYLVSRPIQGSSRIVVIEVTRAVARARLDATDRLQRMFGVMSLIDLNGAIVALASRVGPATLRSLDAIHLATAMELGSDLEALVTYDQRLADAARTIGVPVTAPA